MLKHNLFVVARNLAANRLIDGPVVFCEPYFMNQRETVERLLAGDYDGVQTFNKKEFPSIFQEYAGALVDGILEVYGPPRDPRLELVAETHADASAPDTGHTDAPPKDKPASTDKPKDKPEPAGPGSPG